MTKENLDSFQTRLDELSRCEVVLGQIPQSVVVAGSSTTRNEVVVSILQQAAVSQVAQPDADFVLVDPSYSVGPYDKADQRYAEGLIAQSLESNPNAFPSRKNFSSRVYFVLAELIQQGYVFYAHPVWDKQLQPGFICRLTPRGLALVANPRELEEIFPIPKDDLCFVIMSFSEDKRLADFYRFGIKAAVEGAGYRCARVDEVEHNRRITDLVLQQIESSRFVVADLTEARPNCYYELCWAHRAKKDVVLSVHSSTPIHFDVKDYNFIVYESASELHDRLHRRIVESIGPGPVYEERKTRPKA